MTRLITIDNLTMEFSGIYALKNISFTLDEGEILGIIGRSGAGKTVLIHLLRGIEEPPTSGKIIYHIAGCPSCDCVTVQSHAGEKCTKCDGIMVAHDVDFWNPDNKILKRRILARNAIMFQRTFALYGTDRVIDNVIRALDDIGYPSGKAVTRAADLIDQVHLSHG